MGQFMLRFLFFSLAFLFISCATSHKTDFDKIKTGMDRSDVIDQIGSPLKSGWKNGTEIWVYRFYGDGQWIFREVHFKNDFVSYVGGKTMQTLTVDEKKKKLEEEIQGLKK